VFDAELGFVGDMLILAAAAGTEIGAGRLDALGCGLDDAHEFGAPEALFNLGQFQFDFFADENEGNEHDKFLDARDPFASEGDVADANGYFLSRD